VMFPITDWPLHILNAEQGDIGYIDEVMGAYRYHAAGYYSSLSQERKLEETYKFYRTMDCNLDYVYTSMIKSAMSKYFFDWAREYAKHGEWVNARKCLRKCLQGRPLNHYIRRKELLKLGILLCAPAVATRVWQRPLQV